MAGIVAGKVALVTGAGSGIGRSTALIFGREGASVVAADIDEAGGQETVATINRVGGQAQFVRCDVTSTADVQEAIAAAVNAYGRLDCGFNNAGIIGPRGRMSDLTEEDFDRVLAVDLRAVFVCMKYELQQMLKQGFGAIVNTSSAAGIIGSPELPAYGAAKHGVLGLTKSAAIAYGRDNIRVNAVCPGFIETAMTKDASGHFPNTGERLHANGRNGTPEEVAEAVVWLCSDAASLVSGIGMPIDSAWTIR